MKLSLFIAAALLAQFTNTAFAAISADQLRQLAGSKIQCEQKDDGGDVVITFENCKNLSGKDPSCDVIANTDDDTKKLMTIDTSNTSLSPSNTKLFSEINISDGNDDDSVWGPTLIYDRDDLTIAEDGSGFYYHQRNDGTFWDIISPLDDKMDFQNCQLPSK